MDILKIENQELQVLLELDDLEYSKIIICTDDDKRKIFVIDNKIVKDKKIIKNINEKYQFNIFQKNKGLIF